MNLFYTPEYAKMGDIIPHYNEETKQFDNFYLKNWNPDTPKDMVIKGWHHFVTADHRNFEESPLNLDGGTGCIVKVGDTYHMFYCTFDFGKKPVLQWARHAVSRDLENWEDIPEDKFGPDGKIYRRRRTGGILMWSGMRMSRSMKGPWIRPKVDTFDGRAFYAGKTVSDGKDRYIYGWNPTKGENKKGFDPGKDFGRDYCSWNWGGTEIVHKIVQHEDGTLGVCPVDGVSNAFGFRMYNWKDRNLGFFVAEGDLEVRDVKILTE